MRWPEVLLALADLVGLLAAMAGLAALGLVLWAWHQ